MPTRQNIFKLKRSNISGKIPTISGLTVGELAINTQDGFLYTSIADSGGTTTVSIRQIGWDRLSTISGGTVNGPVIFNSGVTATTFQTTSIKIDGPTTAGYVLTTDVNGNGTWQASTGSSGSTTDNFVTGGTFNSLTRELTLNRTNGSVIVTGITDTYVTGLTVSNSVLILSQNNGQSGLTATIGLKTKVGSLSGGTFAGNPKTATVTFTSNFSDSNYAIFLTGGQNRTYTYENQSVSGFTINANANPAFTPTVYWQEISYGETL